MLKSLGALFLAGVALALTNPGEAAHKKVAAGVLAERVGDNSLLQTVAANFLESHNVVPVTYNNYVLFSTTAIDGKTATIGLLTKVWKAPGE